MKIKFIQAILPAAIAVFLLSFATFAQTGGTIRGTITSEVNGKPLAGVSVTITQLFRSTETDDNGVYEFKDVPAGRYTIVTHTDGFSDRAQPITIDSGTTTLDFAMSIAALREEVTVTATGTESSVFESFQSVTSVGSTNIREQASTSIGETLEREAGIGKRSFGAGSSRPTIRGFEGDRVLILQDGVRNSSLGSQSGDHGEPINTLNLERLEVIKGPATLLYGSNAIGGVVNAVTADEDQAHTGLRGYFTALGGTVNRQRGFGGGIEYGFKKVVLNFGGSTISEGDFNTPLGKIPNSSSRAFGGTSSIGYYGDKFFINGFFNFDRRRYGVPYAPLFEEGAFATTPGGEPCEKKEKRLLGGGKPCIFDIFAIQAAFANQLPEIPDEQIDLKMKRNNYRLRGGFRDIGGPIQQGNFSIDFSDYQHEEIETADGIDEIATTFTNDVFSYRAMFQQAKYKRLSGRFGFEGFRRSYLTEGAEQLVDGRVRQNNFAVFGLQEIEFDRVAFEFGGRIESNSYSPVNTALYNERSFTGFSGAVGARFRLWENASLIASFTSSYRAPALEELYNFGPHIGTVTFEVGNENLTRERSNGFEVSLRQNFKRIRINGSAYIYNIDNFVFLAPQDADDNGFIDVEDNLPVAAYFQNNAKFVGADVTADFDIHKYFGAFVIADFVSANLQTTDGSPSLPRITPARLRLGGDFRYKGLSVRPELTFVGKKDLNNIFPLETPTAGYGIFNINGSYTYATDHYAHIFTFGGANLTDKLYRNHQNFIKDLLPEVGRGFRVSYTIRFF